LFDAGALNDDGNPSGKLGAFGTLMLEMGEYAAPTPEANGCGTMALLGISDAFIVSPFC
jgi:hypothetical protein